MITYIHSRTSIQRNSLHNEIFNLSNHDIVFRRSFQKYGKITIKNCFTGGLFEKPIRAEYEIMPDYIKDIYVGITCRHHVLLMKDALRHVLYRWIFKNRWRRYYCYWIFTNRWWNSVLGKKYGILRERRRRRTE